MKSKKKQKRLRKIGNAQRCHSYKSPKVKYTRTEVLRAVTRLRNSVKEHRFATFECAECGCWHIGTKIPKPVAIVCYERVWSYSSVIPHTRKTHFEYVDFDGGVHTFFSLQDMVDHMKAYFFRLSGVTSLTSLKQLCEKEDIQLKHFVVRVADKKDLDVN